MIAKRVDKRADVHDNYTHLAEYIAAASEEGGKLDKFWIVNSQAGTELADLEDALLDIEAVRAEKPRIKNKIYHLVVSFRPGEREKLSPDDLKDIEQHFAEALGFAEHQRVVGTHVNTDNFHMHVAYNKIHPETFRCHTPGRDFFALESVCRAMERKYGLYVDKGLSDTVDRDKNSQKARRFEAQTWQQSFEGHLREHKVEILAAIGGARTWRQVHDDLAEFDAGLKKRGAGLVFFHLEDPKRTMNASSLDRACSLAALEQRFGPFEPAREKAKGAENGHRKPRRPYVTKPLFHHPGQDRLWRMYQSGQRQPGFLSRNLHIRNWKSYLMADAHKDALALATIIFYKELFHMIEGAPAPTQAPKAVQPALQSWFSSLPWLTPESAVEQPGHLPGVGLKADEAGRVLFPMRDGKGRIWAVRAVDPQGRICDVGDISARPGLRHVIDRRKRLSPEGPWRGTIVVATSCVSAAEIHRATGLPVVIAAREKDLPDLTKELRGAHPENSIVIVASNKSRAAVAAARLVNGRVMAAEAVIEEKRVKAIRDASRRIAKAASTGRKVNVDPDVAEAMGAFVEEALSSEEASGLLIGPPIADERLQRISRWVAEAAKAGEVVSVDPEVAKWMGAFVEEALSPGDAWKARDDAPNKVNDDVGAASRLIDGAAATGRVVSVDPDLAMALGAFVEDALSPEDARKVRPLPNDDARKRNPREYPKSSSRDREIDL